MDVAGRKGSDFDISNVIAPMYHAARDPPVTDFRSWAIAHCRQWVDFHSASWVSGCMRDGHPVFHDVYTEELKPGYWECFLTLADVDPLGPLMFANPGRSYLTSAADFPPLMVERWLNVFDVASAISGMAANPATGGFSTSSTIPIAATSTCPASRSRRPWPGCRRATRASSSAGTPTR